MKNYLVKSLFKVKDTDWKVHDRSHEKNLYENYVKMHKLSLATYKKFLQGDWELKFLDGEVDHISQAFEKTFWFIHDLWHSEPCNILYTDPDTIAIKPVGFWNEFDTFRMFNHTDPKEFWAENSYKKSFPHFFNAGVRYFPAAMSKDTWQIGANMARNWDHSSYNTEQIILNEMMWSQKLTIAETFKPVLAWQLLHSNVEFCQKWNGCEIDRVCILHLHGSRNAESRVNFMEQYVEQIGLDL